MGTPPSAAEVPRTTQPPASNLSDADLAISIENLTKVYRRRNRRQVAVDRLTMHVPRHGVHGFLGPNGAGKTTTIRMLLGLVRANAGTMTLLGEPVPAALPHLMARVGAIVESPKFFPNFTARQNLELMAGTIGVPRPEVDRVLQEVGLSGRANDRFGSYSLGMKQRLAIAGTLLKDPEVLIFDEPTNGLDPAGIQEIRETIRGLGAQGRCVLVSSHILSEVQQVADTVSIIGRGRLLAEGRVGDLMGGDATVRVRVSDPARAQALLDAAGLRARHEGGALLVPGGVDPARVNKVLARGGLYASELVQTHRDLEQVFLELTRGEAPNTRDAAPTTGGAR